MISSAQLPLDLGHRPALRREDFLISPGNEVAVKWIDRWPDWPGGILVLQGPAGAGKTHLAAVWQGFSDAEQIEGQELLGANPLELAHRSSALLIENADLKVLPEPGAEAALFHLINAVRAEGSSLLITALSSPKSWQVELPDLASRLAAIPVAELGALDDALMEALLVKLFYDRQLKVPADVVRYIVDRMERSPAAARDMVANLDSLSLAERRKLTVPLVRRVLMESSSEDI